MSSPDNASIPCVGYVRVSTDKQEISPEAQREKLTSYCGLYGLALVETVVEPGASAKTLARPGLARALGLLGSVAEALVVVKLDRLTRSVRDLGELLERYFQGGDFALHSVEERIDTKSASGRLVLNVLTSVSQWEREAIGERTSTAMQYKIRQGEYTGGKVPYGYRRSADGKHVEPYMDEQVVIARARKLRSELGSMEATVRALEQEGYRSRSGKPFEPVQVRRMLKRLTER